MNISINSWGKLSLLIHLTFFCFYHGFTSLLKMCSNAFEDVRFGMSPCSWTVPSYILVKPVQLTFCALFFFINRVAEKSNKMQTVCSFLRNWFSNGFDRISLQFVDSVCTVRVTASCY